jgi:amino acid transporter
LTSRRVRDQLGDLHRLRGHHTTGREPGAAPARVGLSGLVIGFGALTYTELATMFPKAGGQYVYLREGISPLCGYL